MLLFLATSTIGSELAQAQTPRSSDADGSGRLRILDDSGIIGSLGAFHGPRDTIDLEIVPPTGVAPEGSKELHVFYQVGPLGWAGLFLKPGAMEDDKAIDTSRYAKKGELRFWIQSTDDVQVGIRSRNITPGQERSKLWLRREELAHLDGRWERVCIELNRFAELESNLRFSEMQVMLMVAVASPRSERGFIAIDDVGWFLSPDSREPQRQSAPLAIGLGVEDFIAADSTGGSCKLSNSDGKLEFRYGRPSSGHSSTELDLKSGALNFTWDLQGIGHGYQIVLPFGDPRYPSQLANFAARLREWTDLKVTTYQPERQTSSLPAETRAKLKIAAAKLLALGEAYPTIKHDTERDAVWEGAGADTTLRIRATAFKARKVEVVGRTVSKASIDPEVGLRERRWNPFFSALLPFAPQVYEEAVGQAQLRQLQRFEMVPREGVFEIRIRLSRTRDQFYYVIVAQGDGGRAAECLPTGSDVFVSPE